MKRKVESLARSITAAVSVWESVECVTVGEHSDADVLDPYFALTVDVYLRGSPPTSEERQAAFAAALGQPGAFESSATSSKDRFFIGGLPIRVEYKSISTIDDVLERSRLPDAEVVWIFKNSGTYMFYRLKHSVALFDRSAWLKATRKAIDELPPDFWLGLRDACLAKMEHYLADLGAASVSDDGYFYDVSLAGFIRYAAAALFMSNQSLEPSHRYVTAQLRKLPRLPDDFPGRWDSLLRSDGGLSRAQKYKIAELLAKSILALR
jgi:hypothetical protein